MTIGTKRFTFENGDWWEVYEEKIWRAQRAVAALSKKQLRLADAKVNLETGKLVGEVSIDPENWDPEALDEALLLNSTLKWSYSPSVTAEILGMIPAGHVHQVIAWIDQEYKKADPLAIGASANGSEKTSSLRS